MPPVRRLVRTLYAVVAIGWLAMPPAASAQNLQYLSGQNVVPAFEGWERNPDGSFTFYFGYLNRNYREEIYVPLGPDNRLEPDHLTQPQPEHFYPRRHRFLFSVQVPADWGDRDVSWTVTFDPWHMAGIDDRMPGWAPPDLPPDGRATTTATFDTPGTYVMRAMADDGYLYAALDITVTVTEGPPP